MNKTEIIYLLLLAFILPVTTSGQFTIVRGTITNEKGGSFLENVNILETISGIGTISNATGEFRLMLMPGTKELQFTLDGFKSFTSKLKLKNDTTVFVQLEPQLNPKIRKKPNEPGLAHQSKNE